ncbi:MAG TPA: cation-transporting P-type ATPase, partial [Spongiibacteraceae bacterium]|nr:cation-transporting P-type ATPase [Spongiibacteraceae bacterium]
LGSITYICSDKTGTLTQNKMQVETIFSDGSATNTWQSQTQKPWPNLFTALALSNDAEINRAKKIVGDPTEIALYHAALAVNFDKKILLREAPRVLELPFDSQRKCMTTFHTDGGDGNLSKPLIAYTKGAPETLVPRCVNQLSADGIIALDHRAILAQAERMAADGLRVLAFAQREWTQVPQQLKSAEVEAELTFVGLVGLIDPPRREAAHAVAECKNAGITPVMITGDHPATAAAIARKLGIIDHTDIVLTGSELAKLNDDELEKQIASVRVFARVDPTQKIRIVGALQKRGEFVAMTGDGVNDAPALKNADIGVAMGKGGTDVAREASSLVLLDDNFASIVGAVREGRRIYDNIRKFIRYVMTGNAGEIWTIFLAPLLGLPTPLLPIHILWVNLVTDGLPGLALAAEPAERDIMQRAPRAPQESIFARGMWQHMIWAGLAIGAVSLFAQAWAIHIGSSHWQTMVFTVLTLSQMGHVLAIRSEHISLLRQGLLSNPQLLGALVITVLLQLAIIYLPWLNAIFNTAPLALDELGLCFALSSVVFICAEIEKWLARKKIIYTSPAVS